MNKAIWLTLAAAAMTGLGAQAAPAPLVAEAAGVRFELRVLGNEVEVTMSAKTAGWVAFGLDPSRRMRDADFVLGYVKDGQAYARDDYGNSDIAHAADSSLGGQDDIISAVGEEKDGVTTIRLRLKRLPADPKDRPWSPGPHKLLLAYGPRDDFTSKHARAGSVMIEVPAP
jgi:hypothetical protein